MIMGWHWDIHLIYPKWSTFTNNYGLNHHFEWDNLLFLWPFSSSLSNKSRPCAWFYKFLVQRVIALFVRHVRRCLVENKPVQKVSHEVDIEIHLPGASVADPPVNCSIAMENHTFSWENPRFLWPCSSYVTNYRRVSGGFWDDVEEKSTQHKVSLEGWPSRNDVSFPSSTVVIEVLWNHGYVNVYHFGYIH